MSCCPVLTSALLYMRRTATFLSVMSPLPDTSVRGCVRVILLVGQRHGAHAFLSDAAQQKNPPPSLACSPVSIGQSKLGDFRGMGVRGNATSDSLTPTPTPGNKMLSFFGLFFPLHAVKGKSNGPPFFLLLNPSRSCGVGMVCRRLLFLRPGGRGGPPPKLGGVGSHPGGAKDTANRQEFS